MHVWVYSDSENALLEQGDETSLISATFPIHLELAWDMLAALGHMYLHISYIHINRNTYMYVFESERLCFYVYCTLEDTPGVWTHHLHHVFNLPLLRACTMSSRLGPPLEKAEQSITTHFRI